MEQNKYLTTLKKSAGLLIVLMTLSCSLIPNNVEIVSSPLERKIIHPNLPNSLDLKEPFWYVVSKGNFDEFVEEMKKQNGTVVFFAMSVPDYELMSYNMQELKRYISELKEVVVYYRTITEVE